jgi:hypothetical protein
MDTIPVELLTQIAVNDLVLFTTLLQVPTIGQRLCEWYPQMTARGKFITYKNNSGCKYSYLNNRLHSFNDQPAIDYASGNKYWYRRGKLHRRDLPAIEGVSGSKEWYWHGKLHRENDLPAGEYAIGAKEWYWHGQLHRENDLPAIVWPNGNKQWYWHSKRHRENDLPAIECADGRKEWFIHGKFIK